MPWVHAAVVVTDWENLPDSYGLEREPNYQAGQQNGGVCHKHWVKVFCRNQKRAGN